MRTRFHPIGLVLGMMLASALLGAADRGSSPPARPAIREFDIATTCRLGREIYRDDQLAWVASDVLLAGVSKEKLAAEHMTGGWVVDTSGPAPLVRFLRPHANTFEAGYDVAFAKDAKPKLVVPQNRELTPVQLAHTRAAQTALAALRKEKRPWCGGHPNTVVLPDPEKDGLLVYVLRPKEKPDDIPIGGHYRVSTSADGLTVTQIDQLFVSCLTLTKRPPADADPGTALLFMSHLVSARPLETHVFLSLQDSVPFMVSTPDGTIWHVNGGTFTRVKMDGRENGAAESK